jgi:hypothetical protein
MDTTQIKSIMADANLTEYDTDNDNKKLDKK